MNINDRNALACVLRIEILAKRVKIFSCFFRRCRRAMFFYSLGGDDGILSVHNVFYWIINDRTLSGGSLWGWVSTGGQQVGAACFSRWTTWRQSVDGGEGVRGDFLLRGGASSAARDTGRALDGRPSHLVTIGNTPARYVTMTLYARALATS